jgi:hypothetical protein
LLRKTIRTGRSWGARGARAYYRKVNLCPDCYERLKALDRRDTKILLFVVLCGAIAALIAWYILKR